ncbi:MAG: hypothetical protein ACJA2N_001430 [Salibacteraceae bacterium]|jgi:hypothetical protein
MEQALISKEKYPLRNYPSKVTYRLLTIEEWENIAAADYSDKTQKGSVKNIRTVQRLTTRLLTPVQLQQLFTTIGQIALVPTKCLGM